MKRPGRATLSIDDAVKAATEAARMELERYGYGEASASITVSAYTETSVNSVTLTVGTIPLAQSMGGYARAAKLPAKTRSEIARKAANARWGRARDNGNESSKKETDEEG